MAELKNKSKNTLKEITFVWSGIDRNRRKASGELFALDEKMARAELRRQGINVSRLKKKEASLFSKRAPKIIPADIAIFARQLATMLKAGIPVVQALDIVGYGSENSSLRELILTIKVGVESGNSLTQSLRRHPDYFDDLFCNLVEAGERAGVLESLLDKIATYKEKSESMKKKIKKALTYPISVVVVALLVTTILLVFVVPVFEDLFKSFGADLPVFTKMVIAMSKWMQTYWWIVGATIAAAVYAFKHFKKQSKRFNYALDAFLLRVSIVGVIMTKSAIARFARTLATMSAAGVPLVESLESAAGTCGNLLYFDAVLKMRDEVAMGQRLQYAISESGLFPHMVQQMVTIGEESGALDAMLSKVADFYEEEVDNLVDNLSSLMEPMIMVILGILVGGLIVAMYLPIFQLGSAIH